MQCSQVATGLIRSPVPRRASSQRNIRNLLLTNESVRYTGIPSDLLLESEADCEIGFQ